MGCVALWGQVEVEGASQQFSSADTTLKVDMSHIRTPFHQVDYLTTLLLKQDSFYSKDAQAAMHHRIGRRYYPQSTVHNPSNRFLEAALYNVLTSFVSLLLLSADNDLMNN